jgi:molybdate transport system regulatory protein
MNLPKLLAQKGLRVRSKVWLEIDGEAFFGEGRYAILEGIEIHGSLARAAEESGVTYRRIRGVIYKMEQILGLKLVIRSRGGRYGGGAVLTEAARELMGLFEKQKKGIRESVDELHRSTFV